jgi:hypothetical protein
VFVSYVDTSSIRHTVEVEAESLYKAAVLAIRTFRQHDCEPKAANTLEIEVTSSVKHTITIRKLHDWIKFFFLAVISDWRLSLEKNLVNS